MALYGVNNRLAGTQQALAATFKTLVALSSVTATLKRGRLWEVDFGADGAPNATDCQIVWDISRQTGAGTGSAATPTPLNPADVASGITALVNCTVEPTVTAASSLFSVALNQRASQCWRAMSADQALVWPATNLAGIVVRALSPIYAANALAQTHHEDM